MNKRKELDKLTNEIKDIMADLEKSIQQIVESPVVSDHSKKALKKLTYKKGKPCGSMILNNIMKIEDQFENLGILGF